MTDPFRPRRTGQLDRDRLARAGLDEQALANVTEAYDEAAPHDRAALLRWINGHSDEAIRERFAGNLTREQLTDLTVEELEDRLRERKLSTRGRKAELVDRLLGAAPAAAPPAPAESPAAGPDEAPEGDGTPEAPTGPQAGTQTPDAAGDGSTDDEGGTTA